MAALIGVLRVSLSADTAAFQSGMKRAERQAKTSSSAITRSLGTIKSGLLGFASGISIGLITQGIKASLDYAGSLGEVAQQLGVTTRELQTFRYAVSQNGGSIEEADKALGKFSLSISKAQSGSKQAIAAFNAVGVSLRDLSTKSKSEILGKIADEMKRTGGASANAAAGVAIFGKGFQKIIPTLDQGSAGMTALAQAADELGIVLSDEQIQNADKAADKIDALMTVLKARIAGDVADNADSIFQFVDALFALVKAAEQARAALVNFQQNYNLPNLLFKGDAFGVGKAGRSATADLSTGGTALALAKKMGLKVAGIGGGSGGGQPQFLRSGGGGGGRSRKAPRDTSARDAFQFEEEQRRAEMDILRAKQDLAHDYVDRTALSIQILNLEKEGFEAQLKYEVAAGEKTQAQADSLKLKNDETDHLKRMVVLEQQEEDRQRDYNMLDDRDFDAKMDLLEMQADLAETASERRAIELKILDLAYEEERRRLERIIQESKDWAEIEAARRALLDLSKKQSLDRAGVIQSTRGPMEDWQASLPTSAAKMQEAFEQLQVQGFEGLIDAAVALTDGFDSAKDALLNTLKQFLQGLIKAQLQSALGSIIPAGGFKLPAFAGGGSFTIGGRPGVDRNMLQLNGMNIARVSYGERVNVSNDNGRSYGGRGDTIVNVNGVRDFDSFRRNERQTGRAARRVLGI